MRRRAAGARCLGVITRSRFKMRLTVRGPFRRDSAAGSGTSASWQLAEDVRFREGAWPDSMTDMGALSGRDRFWPIPAPSASGEFDGKADLLPHWGTSGPKQDCSGLP
jgi:hypothetical protein